MDAQKARQDDRTSKIISNGEIQANQKLVDLFPGQANSNVQGKPLEGNEGGILFDTNYARYFEYGDYHSYTFPVVNTPRGEGLENVVFALRENGNYGIFLVQYDLTDAEMMDLADHKYVEITPEAVVTTSLGPDYTPISELGAGPCAYLVVMWCSEGNHDGGIDDGGGYCPGHMEMVMPVDCGGGTWSAPDSNPPPPEPGNTNDWYGHDAGSGSSNPDDPYTGPVLPIDYISDVENCIQPTLGLLGGDNSWWAWLHADEDGDGNLDNFLAVRNLSIFLSENGCSEEATAFGKAAAKALAEGGEVDFEERIIYDLPNKPCQSNILQNLTAVSSPFTDLINQTFNINDQTNLEFSSTDIQNGNYAQTDPRPAGSQQSYYISIAFDNTYLDTATDLSIAATALHEMVHAYLINLYMTGQMSAQSDNYNDLLNAFIAFYDNMVQDTANTLDNEIHNAMIDFIDQMANSIYNYATANNISGVTVTYSEKLAWSTMYGTDLFQQVLTSQQQIDYGNVGAIEADNMQSQNPKGTPCP
jgi:hypothetical protein